MEKKDIKEVVKEKYGQIAGQSKTDNEQSCCGATGCCGEVDYTIFSENYSKLDGYNPDADLGLGCGIPTEFAGIKDGHFVLDLGSGAGNDCFVARYYTGESGHVTGLDFTDEMLVKANANRDKLGVKNIDFVKGDIENMPLPDNKFDVIISNCVLNLVPDKNKAFSEMFRVLKPGGHFCVSDVVIKGDLPEKIKQDSEMYAGCVAGAIDIEKYLYIINASGFKETEIKKEKEITIPNSVLLNYLTLDELRQFKKDKTGIYSVTVVGYKK
ncbi:MAG: arsenite S-adenosylmethyltransferase [Bacteroidetes bacterium GWF2_38_335]|nr:MAG: arsenite S-adenosylmethyltransferase [Bacteroidetes bacterium GWF2_38_335]OFY80829.1 MAG: arsenite S-adenosylmethyltransferase [Bacteroidetes bacterium RIFOXYA12_FULL_38_20]HBS86231.1 arsenite S-adenosylmethyltransferase [Bacteroidales bacterium]